MSDPLPTSEQPTVNMPPPANDQATIDLPPPATEPSTNRTAITALANNDATVLQPAGTGSTGSRTAVTANDPTLMQSPGGGSSGAGGGSSAARTAVTDATLPMQSASPTTGSIGRTSIGTGSGSRRIIRTRLNEALPGDTRHLDLKLQQSRVSVFTDMTELGATAVPPGVQRLVDEHGTAGRYAVHRPLAAGGMGAVLEIRDGDFQRRAAMKVIHGRYSKDPNALERFLAEAQVTAQLEHPNIVPVHDLGVMEDGTLYFTMKLIEGQSFGGVVKKLKAGDAEAKATWTEEALILAFLKALDGVGFAHSRGVVHRDLKPDNVMIGAHGEVLVVDWGLAKVMADADRDSALVQQVEQQAQLLAQQQGKQVVSLRGEDAISATMQGQIMGTPAFMPPEQARGELDKVDARSDIYSLGAMLYELLTLAKPVSEDGGLSAMVQRVSRGDLIPISRVAPHLPADLAAVVTRSMAFAREQRYASCAAFAEDLRRYLAGQAVVARQRSLLERTAAWLHAHRKQVLITAGGLAIAAIAVTGTLWQQSAARHAEALRLMQDAEQQLAGKELEKANTSATRADEKEPTLPGLAALQQRIAAELAIQKQDQERAAKEEAGRKKALDALAKAGALREAGDLDGAKSQIDAAITLDPTNADVDRFRQDLAGVLRDANRIKLEKEAQNHRATGDGVLAKALALPLLDGALDALLKQAEEAYTLSGKDGVNIPGTGDQVARVAVRRQEMLRARRADEAAKECVRLTTEAQQALAAGDHATALARIGAALNQVPGDAAADKLRQTIRTAQADKAAQERALAALTETLRQARELLAAAERDRSGQLQAATAIAKTAATLDRLARLAASDATLAPRLEQARREGAEQQRSSEQLWMSARGRAESARSLVAAQRTQSDEAQALWSQAGSLLAALHFTRWQSAHAAGDRAAAEALQQAIVSYDAAYQPRFSGPGTIVVTGAPGTARLQALTHRDDGRFVADGPVRDISVPGTVAAVSSGRWQMSLGDVLVSVVVEPGTTVTAAFPSAAAPRLAGHDLRWVPPSPGGKSFWFGRGEVTCAQYEAFLNEPDQLKAIGLSLTEFEKARSNNQIRPNAILPFLPRRRPEGDESSLWPLKGSKDEGSGDLTVSRITSPDLRRAEPVTGISRDDAEAFCVWLAKKSGLRVRLPTAAEWRWAASGGDPLRRWPWGDVFDPAHTVSPYIVKDLNDLHPLPAGSRPADIGPFGHVDLAGNVREWLADRRTTDDPFTAFFGAAVAGGSFADSQPERFRSDATESVQSAPFGMMGFRILLESP